MYLHRLALPTIFNRLGPFTKPRGSRDGTDGGRVLDLRRFRILYPLDKIDGSHFPRSAACLLSLVPLQRADATEDRQPGVAP